MSKKKEIKSFYPLHTNGCRGMVLEEQRISKTSFMMIVLHYSRCGIYDIKKKGHGHAVYILGCLYFSGLGFCCTMLHITSVQALLESGWRGIFFFIQNECIG